MVVCHQQKVAKPNTVVATLWLAMHCKPATSRHQNSHHFEPVLCAKKGLPVSDIPCFILAAGCRCSSTSLQGSDPLHKHTTRLAFYVVAFISIDTNIQFIEESSAL